MLDRLQLPSAIYFDSSTEVLKRKGGQYIGLVSPRGSWHIGRVKWLCGLGIAAMKTLHLLRHAKSSWREHQLADIDRGLNKRGLRDAPRMGEALAERLAPMSLAVSPAKRAQLTLEGLIAGWPALADYPHYTESDLYTFDAQDLLSWVAVQQGLHSALFIIGHNPALTELVNQLVGDWVLDNLPTAGYVELQLPIDRWSEVLHCQAQLKCQLFPKQLP